MVTRISQSGQLWSVRKVRGEEEGGGGVGFRVKLPFSESIILPLHVSFSSVRLPGCHMVFCVSTM